MPLLRANHVQNEILYTIQTSKTTMVYDMQTNIKNTFFTKWREHRSKIQTVKQTFVDRKACMVWWRHWSTTSAWCHFHATLWPHHHHKQTTLALCLVHQSDCCHHCQTCCHHCPICWHLWAGHGRTRCNGRMTGKCPDGRPLRRAHTYTAVWYVSMINRDRHRHYRHIVGIY